MGRVSSAPLPDGLRRRLAAAGLALVVNLAFLALLVFLPRPVFVAVEPDTPNSQTLNVVLVTLPPPPAVEEAPVPVEQPAAQPAQPDPPEAAEPVAQDDAIIAQPGPDEEDDEEDDNEERPAETAPPAWAEPGATAGEALPFPAGPGSSEYAVREIFCLSTSQANRRAMNCPPNDGREGLPLLQYASPENIARARAALADLDTGQMGALFEGRALPVRDLDGQPTLADPRTRRTSSADQMRDALPPLHPDPAFGD